MLLGSVRLRLMSYAIVCRRSGLTIPASPGISALFGFEAALRLDIGDAADWSNPRDKFISGSVSGWSMYVCSEQALNVQQPSVLLN